MESGQKQSEILVCFYPFYQHRWYFTDDLSEVLSKKAGLNFGDHDRIGKINFNLARVVPIVGELEELVF